MGVFGGVLTESGGGDGVNDVVAKGVSGKAGGMDGGEWRRVAGARNRAKAKMKRKRKRVRAHGDAGRRIRHLRHSVLAQSSSGPLHKLGSSL